MDSTKPPVEVNPNDLVYLLGAKEAEIFNLRKKIAELTQTVKSLEAELVLAGAAVTDEPTN